MSDSDYSDIDISSDNSETDVSLDTEFDDTLIGSHRFPVSMKNLYGTCFIDSLLNSIANSETLCNHFKNVLPNITNNQIDYAFGEGMKKKKMISSLIDKEFDTDNNISELYKILICIFIKEVNNCENNIISHIRLYLMYLENAGLFDAAYATKIKEVIGDEPFYEFVSKIDYNYVLYYNYCKRAFTTNHTNNFAGIRYNDMFGNILHLTYIVSRCKESDIQKILNNNSVADLFIKVLYNKYNKHTLKEMFAACIKRYEGNYMCTDIIFDRYEDGKGFPFHSVYYNINQSKLLDDGELTEVAINNLNKPLDDGDYYVPCILHFQLRS